MPPPYKRNVWDYITAKTDMIRNDLVNTNWESLFTGLNSSEMSLGFTDTMLNIFSKFMSNKIITCNDKDAPWITPEVKTAIRRNSRVYSKWVKLGRNANDHGNVREIQNSTNKRIRDSQRSYFEKLGHNLSDPQIGQKNFWTAFKRLSNKKKLTNIPPIFHNNIFVSNSQQKANIFNNYFADQCKILDNGSMLTEFISKTSLSLSEITITTDQIVEIIQRYNSKNAHGCDEISVGILQLCAREVALLLFRFFLFVVKSWRKLFLTRCTLF